jgi:general secretion pathway protein A
MYESFFGLKERPFDLAPDPRFLYLTQRQLEALSNLRYGLTTARGFTLLLGEAGTGKTTLLRSVLSEMGPESVQCVLLSNPTLNRDEFVEFLADGFKLAAGSERSKARLLVELQNHLEARYEAGKLTALVLDEAQSLPYELLEEIRLLSNIEATSHKLLNVVLAGQPELGDRLNESRLRQLKQRISLRCELGPFNFQETAAYIAGRLRIAGGSPAEIFSREAVQAIYQASGGVPRTINVICDNALIGGFAAQVRPITRSLVAEVTRDFDIASDAAGDAATRATSARGTERPVSAIDDRRSTSADNGSPDEPAPTTSGDALRSHKRRRSFSFF